MRHEQSLRQSLIDFKKTMNEEIKKTFIIRHGLHFLDAHAKIGSALYLAFVIVFGAFVVGIYLGK